MQVGWANLPLLLAADLVIVSGLGRLSTAIKFFEKVNDEEESFASHVATMINQFRLIEALWRVRENKLTKYRDKGCPVVIVRNTSLRMDERYQIADDILNYYRKPYGVSKIAGAAIDRIIFKDRVVVRKLCKSEGLPICSLIPAKAYKKHGITFLDKDYYTCQPDDISDHALISPDWVPVWADSRSSFRRWISSGKNRIRKNFLETV